ncbi:MAG: hypothetical protein JWQ43_3103 [Glaciihabitans sp.]|nr:hypothetical protein [Glaciihabitans sp.]
MTTPVLAGTRSASARRRPTSRTAGLLLVIGPAVFLLAEAISALAWRTPTYNYAYNFVSDLGTDVCGDIFDGRVMCSPLHAVMNTGFITFGVLFLVGVIATAPRLPWPTRIITVALGLVVGVCLTLVALVHGDSANQANGSLAIHGAAAQYAVESANLVGIILGLSYRRLGVGLARGLGCVVLGIVGILCFRLLYSGIVAAAILERGAVYAIFAWMLIVGIVLLRRQRQRRH